MKPIRRAVLAVLGFTVMAQQVQAAVIYEQPPGAFSNAAWASSSLDFVGGPVGIRIADDFELAAAALITDIHWWGFSNPATPAQGGGDAFTFTFYSDDGGVPGTELLTTTGSLSKSEVSVGSGFDPVNFYASDLAAPFPALGGTTYWVSVFNAAPDASWAWLIANDAGDGAAQKILGSPGWATTRDDLAFQLTAVPEAPTVVLIGVGILLLRLRRAARSVTR